MDDLVRQTERSSHNFPGVVFAITDTGAVIGTRLTVKQQIAAGWWQIRRPIAFVRNGQSHRVGFGR
jgi:hypothetical protein